MDKPERISVNPSCLISLKAELHKKYESFQKAKLNQKLDSSKRTAFKRKGEPSKEKKSIPVITKSSEEISEEELDLKKSRIALEAKTKLYEKITSDNVLINDEDSERFLVDFNRKILYGASMPTAKERPENLTNNVLNTEETNSSNLPKSAKEIHPEIDVTSSIFEKKSENINDSEAVHYQNILFNEVRDHGTAYFAFSTDEAKRKEQMEELNTLRQQTEKGRLASQRLQKKRKMLLEARLTKVCERRNIDRNIVQTYTEAQADPQNSEELEKSVDISSIPLPEPLKATEKKEIKVRPWDVGKTDFPAFIPGRHKIKTQTNWIEERRSERPSQFAPPSSYM